MDAILPGLKAALNYHPVFVHFPIALWLAALFFELLAARRSSEEMHRTAANLLYLGTLGGALAVTTGLYAQGSAPAGAASEALEFHEEVMLSSFSLAAGLCLLAFFARRNFTAKLRRLLLLGLIVLAGLMTLGADRGAQMVYQYGVSVNWPRVLQQK